MAEPDNLVLQLLREIRAKLDEHDRRFDAMDRMFAGVDSEFAALNKKIDDWQETTATAVGLATHANLRNTALEARLTELADQFVDFTQPRASASTVGEVRSFSAHLAD